MDRATIAEAVAGVRQFVQADGADLLLIGYDEATTTLELELDLSGVECLECVMPPAILHAIVADHVCQLTPQPVDVVVRDPRVSERTSGRTTETIIVLDPSGVVTAGSDDPGPLAGSLAGKRIAARIDILWRSFDWVVDEWTALLAPYGATVESFRRVQGLAGKEGAAQDEEWAGLLASADVAVVGLGNCGSCTSWTIKDAVTALDANVATTAIVTEHFEPLASMLASQYGRPALRKVVLPYPLDTRPEPEVREIARGAFPTLLATLGATR